MKTNCERIIPHVHRITAQSGGRRQDKIDLLSLEFTPSPNYTTGVKNQNCPHGTLRFKGSALHATLFHSRQLEFTSQQPRRTQGDFGPEPTAPETQVQLTPSILFALPDASFSVGSILLSVRNHNYISFTGCALELEVGHNPSKI